MVARPDGGRDRLGDLTWPNATARIWRKSLSAGRPASPTGPHLTQVIERAGPLPHPAQDRQQ
jgi:hypothetical protein